MFEICLESIGKKKGRYDIMMLLQRLRNFMQVFSDF